MLTEEKRGEWVSTGTAGRVGGESEDIWTRATGWALQMSLEQITRGGHWVDGARRSQVLGHRHPQAVLTEEWSRHLQQKGSPSLLPHALGAACSSTGSCSVYPREAVAEIKLSSIWTKERILEHTGLLWLIKSTRHQGKQSFNH